MRVLIGYDGSSYADAAIADLQRAGLPDHVEALVVPVGDAPVVAPFPSPQVVEQAFVGERVRSIVEHANRQTAEALSDAKSFARKARTQLKSLFPSWDVQAQVVAGRPADELNRLATHWGADLIVVGTQGRSALGRLILGSVALEVASNALCCVRIGRDVSKTEVKDLRILVGLDRSRAADRVLRHVLRRSWPAGAELRVVNAEDRETMDAGVFRELFVGGLRVSAGIVQGDARDVIIEEARNWQADCVVLGSQLGDQQSEGFFDSGIYAAVIASTECSLEVVR
jgi:nucleotide-binding universal stress UspA family protein